MRNNGAKIVLVTLVTALMIVSMVACSKASPVVTGWTLVLTGASNDAITQEEFEEAADPGCHGVECSIEDKEGTIHIYSGIPLWVLCSRVDDEVEHGEGAFDDGLAARGYNITVTAIDGYSITLSSETVARNDDIILADKVDGQPLGKKEGPLRLVGPELSTGQKVKSVIEIHLDLPE